MSFFDRTGAGLCSAGETVRPALEIVDADGVLIDLTGRTFRYVVIDGDGLVLCDVPAAVAGTRATAEISGGQTLSLAGLVGLEHFFTEQVAGGRRDWLRARLTVRRAGPVLSGATPGGSDAVRVSDRGVMRVMASGAPGLTPWQAAGQTLEEYTGELAQPALDAAAEARDAVANFQSTGARVYRSTAEAVAASPPDAVTVISIYGVGDYQLSATQPSDPDRFQTANGKWFGRLRPTLAAPGGDGAVLLRGEDGFEIRRTATGVGFYVGGALLSTLGGKGGFSNRGAAASAALDWFVEDEGITVHRTCPIQHFVGDSIYTDGTTSRCIVKVAHADGGPSRLSPAAVPNNQAIQRYGAKGSIDSTGFQKTFVQVSDFAKSAAGGGRRTYQVARDTDGILATSLEVHGDGPGSAVHRFFDPTSGFLRNRMVPLRSLPAAASVPEEFAAVSDLMDGAIVRSDGARWILVGGFMQMVFEWVGGGIAGFREVRVPFDCMIYRHGGASEGGSTVLIGTPATGIADANGSGTPEKSFQFQTVVAGAPQLPAIGSVTCEQGAEGTIAWTADTFMPRGSIIRLTANGTTVDPTLSDLRAMLYAARVIPIPTT